MYIYTIHVYNTVVIIQGLRMQTEDILVICKGFLIRQSDNLQDHGGKTSADMRDALITAADNV